MTAPFDPAHAIVIAEAPGDGVGHWSGAPGAFAEGGDLYLVYRRRWPRPRRGGELLLARGDGERFQTVWRATREDFSSESIERCALVRDSAGWRLYVSYVDGRDRRWRIDVIESDAPDSFDPRARRPALDADMANASAVKDPWLRFVDGRWLMFVSFAERANDPHVHATGDALATGLVKSETGLATSADGLRWRWEGKILAASEHGWDRYAARLTSAIRQGDGWLGFYDGAASVAENYEERCGLARSADLRRWLRLGDGPAIGIAGGAGAIRYVESVLFRGHGLFFFERTRPDGAHDLCLSESASGTLD